MERRTLVGILLGIAGLSMVAVSVWLLADVSKFPGTPLTIGPGDSPKVGIAAGIMLLIAAILCCVLKTLDERKYIVIGVILVLLALTLASFGVALKDRLDIKKAEDIQAQFQQMGNQFSQSGQLGHRWERQAKFNIEGANIFQHFKKFKTQLVVMAVIAGIASVLEIICVIIAARFRPSPSPRNAMQMEKPY